MEMKKLRRTMTALMIAAMIALTVVMPASAAGYDTLSVWSYPGIASSNDYSYVYGDHATIHVENDGWDQYYGEVHYQLYDLNWTLLAEGTLYSEYNADYWDNKFTSFSGEYETDSGGFYFYLECDYYDQYCRGNATIDVRDIGPGGGIIYQDNSQYYMNPITSGEYDQTSTITITKPGATNIRVHFTDVSTWPGHAYVTTSAGDYYAGFNNTNIFSSWATGDSITITVTDDGTPGLYDGWMVDYIEYTTQ